MPGPMDCSIKFDTPQPFRGQNINSSIRTTIQCLDEDDKTFLKCMNTQNNAAVSMAKSCIDTGFAGKEATCSEHWCTTLGYC